MTPQRAESQFRARLGRTVRNELGGQCIAVETAETAGLGVPDVELCLTGGLQAWLELKVHDVRSDRPKQVRIRREQARWLRDRFRLGGRAGLLIMARTGEGRREHVLLDAMTAAQLYIEQDQGSPRRWSAVREAGVTEPWPSLDAEWLRQGLSCL